MDGRHLLFKQLGSIRAVTKQTGYSRNTVRRMLRTDTPPVFEKPTTRPSGVDGFKDYLAKRFTEHGLSAERLLGEIRAQGFDGSVYMVRRFLRTLRPMRTAAATATLRFETAPGVQAQCDWAYCGQHPGRDGRMIGVYAFVMVLGFSRALFVKFTTSMRLAMLIECHSEAFAFFGGVPKQVLYDNMKQVKLDAGELNPAFVDFATHHGFAIKTCRPRRARTKGKVERMVDYVKDNFLLARQFADLDDLNAQAMAWLDHTANVRTHATTGHRPLDLLKSEIEHPTPIASVRPYVFIERHPRKVAKESMVSFNASRYSVPPAYVGRDVTVELASDQGTVVIRSGDAIVAEHPAAQWRGESVTQKEHIDELWKLALQRTPAPLPNWRLTFDHAVAATPLDRYERVIDEVGYLTLDSTQASLVFQVIAEHYEKQQAIVLTSNKAFAEWAHVFAGDAIMASAALDRLLHRATVLNVRGDSYRMKDRHRAGERIDVTTAQPERGPQTQGQPKRSKSTSATNGKEPNA